MIIQTKSKLLSVAASVTFFCPIFIAGYITRSIYPLRIAKTERGPFTRLSPLADVVLYSPRLSHISLSFALRGYHEWRNVVIVNSLCREGDTIIDVGSNIGTETLLFAKCVGDNGNVIAFEPLPENFSVLQHNVERNRLQNVKLYQMAVSDKEDKLHFLPPPDDWSIGEGHVIEEDDERQIEVSSVLLDAMFKAGEFPAPRILVMDVEGYELSVLRGAEAIISRCRPFIILEWNPEFLSRNHPPGELYHFVEGHNYRIWRISTCSLVPASPEEPGLCNLLCIPNEDTGEGERIARGISRQLKKAAFLPLIKGMNPAIVSDSNKKY